MKKLFLIPLLILMICGNIFAQAPEATVSGRITDGGDQKIIDAATVSLYKSKDSSLVKMNLTDKDGNFEFTNVIPGNYFLMATSIGHLSTYSPTLSVAENQHLNAGVLKLNNEIKTLKGITITAKKPFIERKIDRTIINVDASITNAGATALEVLEKSPGVSVDKDGNISLKGKAGVTIMLDGKPSYLSGEELTNLLKNMPSSGIDQIEIMTNPSAKYDASGNSGIINIKTKKNKMRGVNGSINTSLQQSYYFKTNNSININYRTQKINLFGNYSYSLWQSQQNNHIVRRFRDSGSKVIQTIFDQENNGKYSSDNNSLKMGMDFYATKKTTIGFVLSGYLNPNTNSSSNRTNLNNENNQTDSITISNNMNKQVSKNFATNLNMRHVFDSAGKEFTVDLDYLDYYQDGNQDLTSNYFYPDFSEKRPSDYLKGKLPSNVNIYSAKTDFTFPMKNAGKIETGIKSSYVTTDNDALYQNKTDNGYVTDYGKTNHFIYKENINAAYINYSKQIKKWGIQAGLRAENTNSKGHQLGNSVNKDSLFTKHYTDLFPTAYLSYELNAKNTFSINYGRRIDRPDYQDLNPFYYFLDQYTYEVGNTLLQPQFTDNIELSHTYNGFLNTTINYGVTHDAFTDVLRQITSERKTFQTKDNIATKTNYGIAVSANFPVTKFWQTNIYTNVNQTEFKGELNGGMLSTQAVTFMGNMSNQIKIDKGWSAEVSGFYRSKGIEGQIVMNAMWRMDAGIQKQVLKNKGSLKLSVRDIFNSQHFSGSVKYQDIDLNINNLRMNRTVSLTFSYRFGKPSKNQPHRRTGGASEEQSRVKTSSE